ncbi:glycerol-3-phosphate responsive antiterminator [Paenibacillus sp. LHD-117]|uniref:glycerol-3-phosphate responsive antiterminator n=1 Tax=Paenibacillus sp. LHD-117 TaxID=3071412 RepID=UPI0027E14AB4|nr:glycerol-3-phosphate responsive antiterminator [Paenibacillus sp. LHD-117]MDQ6422929.1 glycerol-3-phosphate responsive antiterminator [Paenibacillus sp. LHD-117]
MPLLTTQQTVLPAARKPKEVEAVIASPFEYMVLLGGHLGHVKGLVDLAQSNGKKVLLHADLIDGLKNDEYAAEFLCQTIRPAGLISTRTGVIARTKQAGLIAVQRLFLLDSDALEKSYKLLEKTQPDYVEVLPGIMPEIIREVKDRTGVPVIAGGLIRTKEHVSEALAAGAAAITTSRSELWRDGNRA